MTTFAAILFVLASNSPADATDLPLSEKGRIVRFQSSCGLAETGLLDAATSAALQRMADAITKVAPHDPGELPAVTEVEGDEDAIDALASIATTDEDIDRRVEAVGLLRDLRTARSRGTLEQLMYADAPAPVRMAAVDALASFGDAESTMAISMALESESDEWVEGSMRAAIEHSLALEMPPYEGELVAIVDDEAAE